MQILLSYNILYTTCSLRHQVTEVVHLDELPLGCFKVPCVSMVARSTTNQCCHVILNYGSSRPKGFQKSLWGLLGSVVVRSLIRGSSVCRPWTRVCVIIVRNKIRKALLSSFGILVGTLMVAERLLIAASEKNSLLGPAGAILLLLVLFFFSGRCRYGKGIAIPILSGSI